MKNLFKVEVKTQNTMSQSIRRFRLAYSNRNPGELREWEYFATEEEAKMYLKQVATDYVTEYVFDEGSWLRGTLNGIENSGCLELDDHLVAFVEEISDYEQERYLKELLKKVDLEDSYIDAYPADYSTSYDAYHEDSILNQSTGIRIPLVLKGIDKIEFDIRYTDKLNSEVNSDGIRIIGNFRPYELHDLTKSEIAEEAYLID